MISQNLTASPKVSNSIDADPQSFSDLVEHFEAKFIAILARYADRSPAEIAEKLAFETAAWIEGYDEFITNEVPTIELQ